MNLLTALRSASTLAGMNGFALSTETMSEIRESHNDPHSGPIVRSGLLADVVTL